MRALVDTHALLWFLLDDGRLPRRARATIGAGGNELLFSIASCWELAVKCALGKISLGKRFDDFLWPQLGANKVGVLPIDPNHLNLLATLEHHHRDPFDRLLVAQALHERIPIVSGDGMLDAYGVERVW